MSITSSQLASAYKDGGRILYITPTHVAAREALFKAVAVAKESGVLLTETHRASGCEEVVWADGSIKFYPANRGPVRGYSADTVVVGLSED